MLTNKQLKELHTDLVKYGVNVKQVAEKLNISETAVYNILNGKVKKATNSIKQMIEMRNKAKAEFVAYLNEKL